MDAGSITAWNARGSSLRPTLAPSWPPITDPIAMQPTMAQFTSAAMMKVTDATRFTVMASTFFAAFNRCSSSARKMPRMRDQDDPRVAPK